MNTERYTPSKLVPPSIENMAYGSKSTDSQINSHFNLESPELGSVHFVYSCSISGSHSTTQASLLEESSNFDSSVQDSSYQESISMDTSNQDNISCYSNSNQGDSFFPFRNKSTSSLTVSNTCSEDIKGKF